ncbi:DMT family transporter [Acinetobacter gyllenbergii]|uniref:EamA domain-containing protein n=1 Tax=Acinetobacter gyllenbergii CIP 110306 = MTCC 11365 TaxID=1217657 RepID=A0A829HJK6_9GAMM|nr:DMT family transporter [Acinetobacter gyllenbergii]EPF91829.1 hypothetical protein F957_00818 [Acinetobacter gyllenbergii CIP 110306 = MTCC 11365]EPH33641.1 Permease of the drug/metabolite transporter (DMT) superfamily [Acinetobacter gyllenbergii CIP 110306 = MTCC 11365]MCU4580226.1 DMT family transporter [Acinetobacter gyllenbergii]OBY73232.1 multidrug DMT transporter permease [Acinetobacter gyllenbergii]
MTKTNESWLGIIYGSLAALIWAAFPVMTRFGVSKSNLDPFEITFIRFFVSGILVIPYLLMNKNMKTPIKGLLMITVGLGVPYMLIISFGLKYAPVEQFSIMTPACMILFSLLLSTMILKIKSHKNESLGIITIMIGVLFSVYSTFNSSYIFSHFLFIIGGFLWATYTIASRYYFNSAMYATALVCFFSMILYTPFYLYIKGIEIFSNPLSTLIPQIIYQGFFVSIIALFFYSKSVILLGSTTGSVFAALVPILSTLISAVILKETISLTSISGLFIITIGILITIFKASQWKNIFQLFKDKKINRL